MRHVYLAASKSKDPRTKIGATLVRDNNIISTGFNGFPRYVSDTAERYNDRALKHEYVVHAEHNAVLQCAYHGTSAKGTTLYTQGIPCSGCTRAVIQAGVCRIVVHKQWPNLIHSEQWVKSISSSNVMLTEANVEIVWFDMSLGIKGFLDGKEIQV